MCVVLAVDWCWLVSDDIIMMRVLVVRMNSSN